MDHFALEDDPLAEAHKTKNLQRNFQGYASREDRDLIGVGASAISLVNGCYAQNMQSIKDYRTCIDAANFATYRGFELDDDDRIRARLIQDIMCRGAVNWSQLDKQFGANSRQYFSYEFTRLQPYIDDGLVRTDSGGFSVSENGRYFMRNIAMLFDRYIALNRTKVVRLPRNMTSSYSKVL
jgi:oxygen-independent coproporphyrinogen-3 oxidase